MLQFFKQAFAPKSETFASNMNDVIEEIHHSFNNEVDTLLEFSKQLSPLDTNKQSLIDKHERLKQMGFTRAKDVQEAKIELDRINDLKNENYYKDKLHRAINYFSIKYPLYKFITPESVIKLCTNII